MRNPYLLSLLPAIMFATLHGSGFSQELPQTKAPVPIPLGEIGAQAEKQHPGGSASIRPTAKGAYLEAIMQDLEAEATVDGLWITSTAEEDAGKPNRVRVKAVEVGRTSIFHDGASRTLPSEGVVRTAAKGVSFVRPGVVEEYTASTDGVRQDFVVTQRPAGLAGELEVILNVAGARAEAADYGAKLTVTGTGRALGYSRLHVTDALGKELVARMEVMAPDRIRILVQDAGAVYPVRVDPTFSDVDWVVVNPGLPGANGQVYCITADGSGNVYVGGGFTFIGTVAANRIAKWNGSTWSAFGTGMNNDVLAITISGNDVYAGGGFTTAGGVTVNRIARWNGSAWSALGAGANSTVRAVELMGSNVYIGGSFSTVGGSSIRGIAKWNGSIWSMVGTGMTGTVYALQASGTDLYMGGAFDAVSGIAASNIAKWNGNTWSALGSGVDGQVHTLAMQGSNLWVGGGFQQAGSQTNRYLAKWDGSSWSGFGNHIGSDVYDIAVSGSDLYIGGAFTDVNGMPPYVAKWNGSAWSALGDGIQSAVWTLAVVGTDVFVGGDFQAEYGSCADCFARWNGSSWSPPAMGTDNVIYAVTVDGSNLYIGGDFEMAGGVVASRIAKWNGSTWSAMGTGPSTGQVSSLAVYGGNLYAGGFFSTIMGENLACIAKWDGTGWSEVGPVDLNGSVSAMVVSGGELYAGGSFFMIGSTQVNHIAKWNGSTWSALASGVGSSVTSLAAIGSDVYVGGGFTTASGVTVNRIARWNGTNWAAVGTGFNSAVRALAVIGTNLYAAGDFTLAEGTSANRIARWNGSTWSPLSAGLDATVYALAVRGTDLYAGGSFTTAGGIAANRIAKWDGSAWSPLGSGVSAGPVTPSVRALAVGNNGLYVAGNFYVAGSQPSPYLAQADFSPYRPDLVLNTPTPITSSGTTLRGTVNPNGEATTAEFHYGETAAYGSVATVTLSNSTATTALSVSSAISGLNPGTTYHYRLQATNAYGTRTTTGGTFSTLSNNANLSGLGVSAGALDPAFSSAQTGYAVSVGNATTSIAITPTVDQANATVKVNNVTVASGSASGSISLLVGANVINTVVTAQDGTTTKQYTLTVTRAPSSNADLAGLTGSSGAFDQPFSGATLSYTDSVPHATTTLTVTPTVAQANATVKVNDVPVTSGSASGSISLLVGANVINVLVTAQDGTTTKLYTLTVTRAPSSNANLAGLTGSTGAFNQPFSGSTQSYTASVPHATTTLAVTPSVAEPNATVKVNDVTVTSGSASGSINLLVGATTVNVLVTAQDGTTTKLYTLTVTRAGSSNADLAGLTGSIGAFDQPFSGSTLGYTATVPYTTATLTVTPSVAEPNATVKVNGVAVASGSASGSINLMYGSNVINTVVTAQDGTTTKPYTLTVTRSAPLAGLLSFTKAVDVVDEGAGSLTVLVSRTEGTESEVSVALSTQDGVAKLGEDYGTLSASSVTFANGESGTKSVTIPITASSADEPNEDFTVRLGTVTGEAIVGTPAVLVVRIADGKDDAVPSAPTVDYPAQNASVEVAVGATLEVRGNAKDNKGVDRVEVRINDAAVPTQAVLSAWGASSTGWKCVFTPPSGANKVVVTTVDTKGRTSTSLTRNFKVVRPLKVNVLAAHGSVTTGFAPTSPREVGKTYTITATAKTTPAPGYVFDHWEIGGGPSAADISVTAAALELPALTFKMVEGLELTAHFIANPFAALAGDYNGLVHASDSEPVATGGTLPATETEGHWTLTLLKTGAFSGKLSIDGMMLSVGGAFDNGGIARFGTTRATSVLVSRTGKPSVRVDLTLEALRPASAADPTSISGTVVQNYRNTITAVSRASLWRAALPAAPNDITNYVGTGKASETYTAIIEPLPAAQQPSGLLETEFPQGISFATITVKRTGAVTVTCTLSDGTPPFTISSALSTNGSCPLFTQLYSKKGFLSGELVFDYTDPASDLSVTGMLWAKPYQDIQHYPFGWPEVIELDLKAARYLVEQGSSVLTRGAGGTAELHVGLPTMTPVQKDVAFSTDDSVTKNVPSDASFTLSISRATGRISGFFTDPGDNTKPTFQGAVYQKGSGAGAYGYFLTPEPKPKSYDGQSGSVKLTLDP